MALFKKNETIVPKPWLGVTYGQSGIGKTSAAIALNAAIIDTENGSSQYDCMRVPASNMQELYAALKEAYEDTSIQCVCIDTLDALEPWIIAEVLAEGKKEIGDKVKELKDFPFGGGYAKLYDKYCALCTALERIATRKCVLVLAHEKVRTIDDPTMGSYERSTLKIYDKAAQWFFSRADFVLYARHEFMINEGRAINKKKRAVYSQDGVSFAAKSRL
jgi:ABC-type dipeptide/oligopeptide/nickel transport system ATPase subunit